ncbi:MAG TPA: hypothetical protein VFV27_12350 [Nevskiaceae bacterium]|nr:hypothetical protein [Nevskiaceae bacterium]
MQTKPEVAVFDTDEPNALTVMASLGAKGVPLAVYSPRRFPSGRWSPHCRRFSRCPDPLQFDAFQHWLAEELRAGRISRVAPTSDLLTYHCACLREQFPDEVRPSLHTREEIENALIKSRFNQRCEALGLPVPESWYPLSLEQARALAPTLPYPVMIKPKSHLGLGMAYRGAVVADAAAFLAEFREHPPAPGQAPLLARYPELAWPMVQRLVAGAAHRVHSLCGLRVEGSGIVAAAAVVKTDQWPPRVGIGIEFQPLQDPLTLAAGRRVIDAFIRHGLFEIELLVDGEQRLAIDLNPRTYQMISYDVARGHDLPWLWYRSTRGETIPVQPEAREDLHWRRSFLFHLAHWTRILRGPDHRARWRHYRALRRRPAVNATEGSPWWVTWAGNLRLLRHPRSLVRPFWEETAESPPDAPARDLH